MNKKTAKTILEMRARIVTLNRAIDYWESNPLSQPSEALETHLNNVRNQIGQLHWLIERLEKGEQPNDNPTNP